MISTTYLYFKKRAVLPSNLSFLHVDLNLDLHDANFTNYDVQVARSSN